MTSSEPLREAVARIVREHFYPGPLAGSTDRLAAALIAEFPCLISSRGSGGWQPIEMAPTDGTTILIYERLWRNTRMVEFDPEQQRFVVREDRDLRLSPTHWMPLPAPPQKKEGDA